MFNLSDDLKKIKAKVLVLSGIALFIALSKALPQKVAILGLDLSKNETMAGWFLMVVSAYFLINLLIFSVLELIKYYLPALIGRRTANTTGDTIGLTADECFPDQQSDDSEIGTPSGEIKEINLKNQKIIYKYKSNFVKFSNVVKLFTELAFPIMFSIVSLMQLYLFLMNVQ